LFDKNLLYASFLHKIILFSQDAGNCSTMRKMFKLKEKQYRLQNLIFVLLNITFCFRLAVEQQQTINWEV
jgi:hypothetical protein